MVDRILRERSPEFAPLYPRAGRPSTAAEKHPKALPVVGTVLLELGGEVDYEDAATGFEFQAGNTSSVADRSVERDDRDVSDAKALLISPEEYPEEFWSGRKTDEYSSR
jgi:hypothetical protein